MKRRTLITLPFPATVASLLGSGAIAQPSPLKITGVRLVRLREIREVGWLEPAWSPGRRNRYTVGGGAALEIQTNEGLTGLGPQVPDSYLPAVTKQLVGQDPFDTEKLNASLARHARGNAYSGMGCVDIALWDLVGKTSNRPLYKIFGGGREKVPAYASMVQLSTPEERGRLAGRLADEGWKAIKLRLHHESLREDIRTVEEVRKAAGERMAILTDANQAQSANHDQPGVHWDLRRAIETAQELERLGCYFLEEPLPRYAFDRLAELNSKVEIAIAGGENNPYFHEFTTMVKSGAYDILQPDALVCGGLTVLRKIAALAEAFEMPVIPHHAKGNIGAVAQLHLIATWPRSPYLEILHDPPIADYRNTMAILKDPPLVNSDGDVAVPQGPGLGIELNPDLVLPS